MGGTLWAWAWGAGKVVKMTSPGKQKASATLKHYSRIYKCTQASLTMDPSRCLTAAGQHLSKSYGQFELGFKLL